MILIIIDYKTNCPPFCPCLNPISAAKRLSDICSFPGCLRIAPDVRESKFPLDFTQECIAAGRHTDGGFAKTLGEMPPEAAA
jgi:hypothetical protein